MEYKLYSDNKALSAETLLHVSFGWTRVTELLVWVWRHLCEGGRPAMKLNSSFCLVFQKLNSTFQDKCVLILK